MLRKRLQLGFIHVAVAVTLLPINSTLNRVMIKELVISAVLVALLASLPYLFSPIQVAIGSFSDRHPVFGFRRSPYIALGLTLCVLGLVLSPYAAFAVGEGEWFGLPLAVLAFGAWGMGFNFSTVSYLSLATEISGEKGRGKTIALMWFMMILSMIVTSITLGRMLEPYSPEKLIQSFWWVGGGALILGLASLLRLEERGHRVQGASRAQEGWGYMARAILGNPQARLFFFYLLILLAAILGQDLLLEPFAGEAFDMPVQQTTRITAIWGVCVLISLAAASILENRMGKRNIAALGAVGALLGFAAIIWSGIVLERSVFYAGLVLLGLGTGLSTVSNLSLMLDMTTAGSVGLFIGAWGMSNALSRLTGNLVAGGVRDLVTVLAQDALAGYLTAFVILAALMLGSLILLRRVDTGSFQTQAADTLGLVERAAVANDPS
jgi:MFS transporter, BCD family, chlorophyll transporter